MRSANAHKTKDSNLTSPKKKSRDDKPSICPLFFSRQYSRCIYDGDTLQDRVRHVGTLESVEESVAEL